MRNLWLLGAKLDPLTPNSMRRGDTGCRTSPAGGGGCVSFPIEGGGYCSAPSSSAPVTSVPMAATTAATDTIGGSSLCIGASRSKAEPSATNRGFNQIPFGTTGLSGLSAGDYSNPASDLQTVSSWLKASGSA